MRTPIVAVVVLVALGAAGCGSGKHSSTPTTRSTAATTSAPPSVSSTSTTVDPINPDVVPTVITPAYVDAVFKVLNHIDGNATRSLASANALLGSGRQDLEQSIWIPFYGQEVQAANREHLTRRN